MDKRVKLNKIIEKPKGIGVRHWQTLLIFLGTTTAFIIRSDISVGIVAMTTKKTTDFETFNWDEPTKGIILSSFMWGFLAAQIPAAILTHKFRAMPLLLVTILGPSIFTLFIPILAPFHWLYVCMLRFFIGLCQGFILPSCHSLLAKWIHPSERALTSIALTGCNLGVFIIIIISGQIAVSPLGWPGIFYTSSGIGFIWSIIWICFGSESPSRHKRITDVERIYLEEGFGSKFEKRKLPLPLKKIFTSPPFLALLAANCAYHWGYFTLLMEVPSYMAQSLNFNIKSSAIMSAIPYIVSIGAVTIMAFLSDFLINHQYLSRTNARKVFNTIGEWIPMSCMFGLGFVTQASANIAAILLIISIGCGAGVQTGCFINSMDLAPNFAGPLAGITLFASSMLSMMGPIFVGNVVTDPTDTNEWSKVFFATAGSYLVGNLLFIIYGEATVQSWNEESVPLNKKNKEEL